MSKQMDCSEDLTKILYIPQTLLIYVINTYRDIEKISNDCRKPKTKAITEPIIDEIQYNYYFHSTTNRLLVFTNQ